MSPEQTAAVDSTYIPVEFILMIPLFATAVGTPIARQIAIRFGIVDAPIAGSSKTHSKATPYLGGLPLFIGLFVGTYIVLHQSERTLPDTFNISYILSAMTLVFIVGLWDDVKGMIPGIKMALLGIAGTLMFMGGGMITFIPNQEAWLIPGTIIGWALTMFWFLGITNAANLMDNMNGLSAGCGIVAGAAILIISSIGGDPVGIGLSIVLLGSLLGYFFYNFPKARIFFGDSGSMTMGFFLSFLGLMAGRLPTPDGFNAVSQTLAPILVMGIFIYDTFFVAFSRKRRDINFWWGGKDHTSHRFTNYGFSKVFAVILCWLIAALFALGGILIKISPWHVAIVIMLVWVGTGIWFWRKLDKIQVEEVIIGASNIREKAVQKEQVN